MVAADAAWPVKFVDKGEDSVRLQTLRDDIGTGRLASFFASVHELAELVVTAVTKWERENPVVRTSPTVGLDANRPWLS
jgi:hypothetical protein